MVDKNIAIKKLERLVQIVRLNPPEHEKIQKSWELCHWQSSGHPPGSCPPQPPLCHMSRFSSLFIWNLLWTHHLKQIAFSVHIGRRLKIGNLPADILLPPPSLCDKRHSFFSKNKAGFAALKPHPSAQGLLISAKATTQTQYSFCFLWKKLILAGDGNETSLNRCLLLLSKSCEPKTL